MKRLNIFFLLAGGVVLALLFAEGIVRLVRDITEEAQGQHTVATRLGQYGECARRRLLPHFDKGQVSYPPGGVVFVGIKQDKKLEVWACGYDRQFKLIRSYSILGASGRLGPKLREGDCQVPEGIYAIESLNPNSRYHLSLRIDYPNEFDKARAKEEDRTNLGGDIMIHGCSASIGCLAMGDEAAEDLFVLAAETGIEKMTVILTPVDFRENELPVTSYALPEWTGVCYERIREQLCRLRGE